MVPGQATGLLLSRCTDGQHRPPSSAIRRVGSKIDSRLSKIICFRTSHGASSVTQAFQYSGPFPEDQPESGTHAACVLQSTFRKLFYDHEFLGKMRTSQNVWKASLLDARFYTAPPPLPPIWVVF